MSDDAESTSKLQATPQTVALIAAVLTLLGALIGHYVSVRNTETAATKDVDIKKLEVENSYTLEKEKHDHQVTLEGQKFVRDIIAKTLEKGSTVEQIKNLKAYAKINLIGSPYKEALLALRDEELPTVSAPEGVIGRVNDGVRPADLELLLGMSRSVGLLKIKMPGDGEAHARGSGFLVSNRLFLTVGHSLPDMEDAAAGTVAFGFDSLDPRDRAKIQEFRLDPETFFLSNREMDYSLVALSPSSARGTPLDKFGFIRLKGSATVLLGERVSLIHHPLGGPKEIIVQGGDVLSVLADRLQYGIFTQPGSAGAPLLNGNGDVVAIHSANITSKEGSESDNTKMVKEGIRIVGVMGDVAKRVGSLSADKKALAAQLFVDSNESAPPKSEP